MDHLGTSNQPNENYRWQQNYSQMHSSLTQDNPQRDSPNFLHSNDRNQYKITNVGWKRSETYLCGGSNDLKHIKIKWV